MTVPYNETQYQRDERLKAQLELDRVSFLSHWRDLADYLLPRRARFTVTDVNKGDRRNQKILDSTGTLAVRTLRSGMMSGITSPSRPWFRLTVPDPDLAEMGAVKRWLHDVTQRMETVFLRSNLYNSLPTIYGDLGVFGTAALLVEEDFTGEVLRTMALPVGSYSLGVDARGQVTVFVRELQMTVRQLVAEFAVERGQPSWAHVSPYVKALWERGERETGIQVCHIIQPNEAYRPGPGPAATKRFRSVYYERGFASSGTTSYLAAAPTSVLREGGYDRFPILTPRWETTGEDAYGTSCPGMEALGDVKQLQLGEKRLLQAIEKMLNPPMVGPTVLKTTKASILPGDITHLDIREGQQGFRPVYQVDPRIQEMSLKQEEVRQRIRKAFYEELFLMFANMTRRDITAREIEERHEEKLLALGPVLEQMNQDLLDPLVEVVFGYMSAQGLLPPPPPELQEAPDLKVEYVSIMAQAQQIIGLGGIERLASFTGQLAQAHPPVLDKLNFDQMVDVYAARLGVDPHLTRTDEEVETVRAERAQAQQAAAQAEMIAQGAKAAKDLSGAKMGEDNALTRLVTA